MAPCIWANSFRTGSVRCPGDVAGGERDHPGRPAPVPAPVDLRPRRLPADAAGGHRGRSRRPGRAVRDADRGGQEPVLPAPRGRADGAGAGRQPADLPHGEPGRPAPRRGRAVRDAQQQHAPGRFARDDARPGGGRLRRAALRRPRAVRQRPVPRPDARPPPAAVRGGRGALHQPVGPRLPPRLPAARPGPRRARVPAHDRPDGDGDGGGAGRRRPQPGPGGPVGGRHRLRPAQPELRVAPDPRQAGEAGPALQARLPRDRRQRHRLLRHAQGRRRGRGRAGRARADAPSLRLPRRHGRGGADREPGAVAAHAAGRGGGDERLRHGDQQARRAVRGPLQPARLRGGVLPGGRPRRAGRQAGAVRAVVQLRGPVHAAVLHRQHQGRRLRRPGRGRGDQAAGAAEARPDDRLRRQLAVPAAADPGLLRRRQAGRGRVPVRRLPQRRGGAGRRTRRRCPASTRRRASW